MVPLQPAPSRRLTYADYCKFPDDGKRHELIDGAHYVSPSPRYIHQQIIINLASIFHAWTRETENGIVLTAPFDILLSENDIVQPDLIFISNENRDILTEKNAQGAPDITIEVLSPGNPQYDRQLKYHRYEQFGIREYWIIDPVLEEVRVYRLEKGHYKDAIIFNHDTRSTLESSLLPGLFIPLEEVFYKSDLNNSG